MGAPQPVTDDGDRRGRCAFVRREAATDPRDHAEHVKVVRRDELDPEPHRDFADASAEDWLHPRYERETTRPHFDEIEIVGSR